MAVAIPVPLASGDTPELSDSPPDHAQQGRREDAAGSTVQRLAERGLFKPPRWLSANVQYEMIRGSVASGVAADTSDLDVSG